MCRNTCRTDAQFCSDSLSKVSNVFFFPENAIKNPTCALPPAFPPVAKIEGKILIKLTPVSLIRAEETHHLRSSNKSAFEPGQCTIAPHHRCHPFSKAFGLHRVGMKKVQQICQRSLHNRQLCVCVCVCVGAWKSVWMNVHRHGSFHFLQHHFSFYLLSIISLHLSTCHPRSQG